jgi:acetyl esterase
MRCRSHPRLALPVSSPDFRAGGDRSAARNSRHTAAWRVLDPQAQLVLDAMRAAELPALHTLSPEQARERMRASFARRGGRPALMAVDDHACPTPSGRVDLRLYRPVDGPVPAALFLHGGGWTLNDLDTHDRLCRLLARRSGFLIVAVDYRRAPEHSHPAALEDAYFAYRWLVDHESKLGCATGCRALIGESSGATTAACLALLLRDAEAPMPTFQALAYPMTDQFGHQPAYKERGEGYPLDDDQLSWFLQNYLPDGYAHDDPYLFPLLAKDHRGLPPALIMTAEFDPLRDDGIVYAEALSAAGVPVRHVHAEDQMHGFLLMDGVIDRAVDLIDLLGEALGDHAQSLRQPDIAH